MIGRMTTHDDMRHDDGGRVEPIRLQGDGHGPDGISLSELIGNLEGLRDRFGDMPVQTGIPGRCSAIHVGVYERDGGGRMLMLGPCADMDEGRGNAVAGVTMLATDDCHDADGNVM